MYVYISISSQLIDLWLELSIFIACGSVDTAISLSLSFVRIRVQTHTCTCVRARIRAHALILLSSIVVFEQNVPLAYPAREPDIIDIGRRRRWTGAMEGGGSPI